MSAFFQNFWGSGIIKNFRVVQVSLSRSRYSCIFKLLKTENPLISRWRLCSGSLRGDTERLVGKAEVSTQGLYGAGVVFPLCVHLIIYRRLFSHWSRVELPQGTVLRFELRSSVRQRSGTVG